MTWPTLLINFSTEMKTFFESVWQSAPHGHREPNEALNPSSGHTATSFSTRSNRLSACQKYSFLPETPKTFEVIVMCSCMEALS